MANQIEAKAELSVARGCGFGGIAILTLMVGAIAQPPLAFLMGGLSTLIASLILWLKANLAQHTPYKRTELWLLLAKPDRPQQMVAQQLIGGVLREVYLRFALYGAWLALAMLLASIVFGMLPATTPL